MASVIAGWVTRLQSGFYTVRTEGGSVICSLRGRVKHQKEKVDFIAVGDRVQIQRLQDGRGVIEKVEERRSALVRKDPRPKEPYQQVLLANPDQVVIVFAFAQPQPHLRMLDRFLVICEKQKLPALIVANKVDLSGEAVANKIFHIYPKLGYRVFLTSAKTGAGLEPLKEALAGRISALAGPSGAGKTSLLNAIQPGLGLEVREVKAATSKGRHTTVVREMFPLDIGGFVADLPGLRSLALWDTQPEELDGYFPEIAAYVPHCQFNDCSHSHEPGCAVREALIKGQIATSRYESYLRLRAGEE
jgi:ribosome biogenesis GTPase